MSDALLPEWHDDWALFLDVDGTLLKIAATPAAVQVPARAVLVLAGLNERFRGAVALVSGRRIADLDRLFAPVCLPAAGVHGAERRDATGNVFEAAQAAGLTGARDLLEGWCSAHAGALLEDKGAALALHYRGAPALEVEAQRVVAHALEALGPGFRARAGKKVLEIIADSTDKGRAISAFMREPPFHGRVPVFVGDDVTDEDGFDVVNRLGGHSVAVGTDRPTLARWRLRDEREVLAWLDKGARTEGT